MILITGGTGFLGKWLCHFLKNEFEIKIISRNSEDEFKGDLSRWNAGLDIDLIKSKYKFKAMIHLAGLYNFSAPAVDCYLNNLGATKTALNLAKQLDIPLFMNASTVAAAINCNKKTVSPYEINFDQAFPDPYSETKATAEFLIRNWEDQPFDRVNLRLGVLVGDTQEGKVDRLDGPYKAPVAMKTLKSLYGLLPVQLWPGQGDRTLPIVPVDSAALAIVNILKWSLQQSKIGYRSFNLTPEQGLKVADFYARVSKYIGLPPHKNVLTGNLPDALVKRSAQWLAGFPASDLHYILNFPKYDSKDTVDVIGNWCPEFASYERAFWRGYENFVQNR